MTENDLKTQAQAAVAEYNQRLAAIRADRDLSAEAVVRMIREAREKMLGIVNGARINVAGVRQEAKRGVLKKLFGRTWTGPTPLDGSKYIDTEDYRDAVRYADSTPDATSLENLLDRADIMEDRALKRACGMIAFERNERAIVEKFQRMDPPSRGLFERWNELDRDGTDNEALVARWMAFEIPPEPEELSPGWLSARTQHLPG